ncbi:MAG TPA: hypothetical protein VK212_11350 [Lentimicrobium sp.]|nr:hypothetical protein [Lentimicrobium sp.]
MKNIIVICSVLLSAFTYSITQAQDNSSAVPQEQTLSKADSLQCKEQLSLYREYYKIKLYSHAFPHWRWMFLNCPQGSQNIYIDGIKILTSHIDTVKNVELKEKWIDTLLMVYDQRIKYYGREGYVLGRKAIDAISYKPSAIQEAFTWFGRSVELQGNQSDGAVLVYYLNTAVQLANTGKIDKSEVFMVYDKVLSIADYNISQSAGNEKEFANWNNIKSNIETIIEPLASCSDLVTIYEKKFKEFPNDTTLLINMTNILDKRNCTQEGDLFYRATGNLHKLKPSAQTAYLMGKLSIQNNYIGRAAEYMEEAANLFKENTDKIRALYALVGIYMTNRNFTLARSTANKIIQMNPNEGKAYILIGDMYAMSAGMCEEDDMNGKTVFWAAIDKYIKAKSVDSSVEQEANEKISQYARYYPPKQDLFFRDLQEGTSFTVGCWINETTTIRGN